jgi:cytochrome c-type biogenesis protein CcmH
LARRSFQHADHLGHGSNAAALSGLGETLLFENGGKETPAATELFNRALQLDPHSPQALLYTAVALLRAGDLENARARFVGLRELAPPPAVVEALDRQIAAIDVEIARLRPDPATAIHLQVELAASLAAQVPAGASLFVFVRSPQGGPPLAVKRLAATFPQQLDLSAADSVIANHSFSAGQTVQVIARVSAAGTPTASPGDLYGEISAVAGKSGQRKLMVDRRSP